MEYILVDEANEIQVHLSPGARIYRTGSYGQAQEASNNWTPEAIDRELGLEWPNRLKRL